MAYLQPEPPVAPPPSHLQAAQQDLRQGNFASEVASEEAGAEHRKRKSKGQKRKLWVEAKLTGDFSKLNEWVARKEASAMETLEQEHQPKFLPGQPKVVPPKVVPPKVVLPPPPPPFRQIFPASSEMQPEWHGTWQEHRKKPKNRGVKRQLETEARRTGDDSKLRAYLAAKQAEPPEPSDRQADAHAAAVMGRADSEQHASDQGHQEDSADVSSWLDSLKPGWSERFSGAFAEVGIEDLEDFFEVDDATLQALEEELMKAGGRIFHIQKIRRCMEEFVEERFVQENES
eukprot:TRINITY_DN26135_c0_g1_i1.p1 TRINITY_DN26135_c0_g1~~TRINITY_DN26135_c0_g1_i1.p1  ORF type:complete len:288 (-),score=71.51 TRINITY_DN26135_c0_g1_i1:145-1008(-)